MQRHALAGRTRAYVRTYLRAGVCAARGWRVINTLKARRERGWDTAIIGIIGNALYAGRVRVAFSCARRVKCHWCRVSIAGVFWIGFVGLMMWENGVE